MWRIFNKLFGWHYFSYRFGSSMSVTRVEVLPNGNIVANLCCEGYRPLSAFKERQPMALTMDQEDLDKLIEGDK